MFLSEWCDFGALPCEGGGLDDSSRLDVVEIARVPCMLPSLFFFLVELRTYQHPSNIQLSFSAKESALVFVIFDQSKHSKVMTFELTSYGAL